MGTAYSKGFIQALIHQGLDLNRIAFEANFAPFQPRWQKAVKGVKTLQFSHKEDKVAGYNKIDGADYIDTSDDYIGGGISSHKIESFEDQINKLPSGSYEIINGQIHSK